VRASARLVGNEDAHAHGYEHVHEYEDVHEYAYEYARR
jgi:hypothetical protein